MAKEISPDIAILAYHPKWVNSFAACIDSVAREKKYLLLTEGLPPEKVKNFVNMIIEGQHPSYLAVCKNEVIGWCDIKRHNSKALSHSGEVGMGVVQAFRGQGVGQMLIEKALNDAWAKGFAKVELSVYTSNEAALGLYKKIGFLEEGLLRRHAQIDGEYRDSYRMGIFNPKLPVTEKGIRS